MRFLKLLLPLAALTQGVLSATCSANSTPPPLTPALPTTTLPKNYTELSVGVIVYEFATPLDYFGPLQYFDKLSTVGVDVHISTIGQKAGLMRSGEDGIPYHATHDFKGLRKDAKFDVIMITGGTTTGVTGDPDFMKFVTEQATRADYVLSVCTGSAILAATGLLDGKSATTNKMAFAEISATYPSVNWQAKARWVVDGNVWTSSGIAAGIDLGRAFIADVFGEAVATLLAFNLEIVPNTDPSNDPYAV